MGKKGGLERRLSRKKQPPPGSRRATNCPSMHVAQATAGPMSHADAAWVHERWRFTASLECSTKPRRHLVLSEASTDGLDRPCRTPPPEGWPRWVIITVVITPVAVHRRRSRGQTQKTTSASCAEGRLTAGSSATGLGGCRWRDQQQWLP